MSEAGGAERSWRRFITPALFVIAVAVNVVALVRLAGGPGEPVYRFATAFAAVNLVWLLAEVPVTFRLPRTPPREVATLLAYGITRVAMVSAALLGPLTWHRLSPLAVVPVVVFAVGVGLRLVAMRTLGGFYSHHVIRRADHSVVRTGPYRVIRHPAYAGMVLAHLGLVLFFFNAFSAVLFVALVAVIGWRIRVEERELVVLPAYREYALGRPRLLPGVW